MSTRAAFAFGLGSAIFVAIAVHILLGCYGPNAPPVGPDYPPEPPFAETCSDAGRG